MTRKWFKLEETQTLLEETVNASIHGIGILLGIAALILLTEYTSQQHNICKLISGILFSSTVIVLYSTSALYHSCQHPTRKPLFRIYDHMAIYLLIAGTYTPFTLITLHGEIGWILLVLIWSCALLGILFKSRFTGKLEIISTLLYVAMGWMALIAIKPIYHALALPGFEWLLAGGLIYTFGVIFYVWEKLYFSHAVWHICVLAGNFCHFIVIWRYVLPT